MILFRVGQHIKTFLLCSKKEEVNERGRVIYTAEKPTMKIKGSISAVSQEEKKSKDTNTTGRYIAIR